jgi:hypothetical protein
VQLPGGECLVSVGAANSGEDVVMFGLLVLFLIVWLVVVVLGIAIKGLFWLVILGAVLFVVTGVIGFVKREALGRKR